MAKRIKNCIDNLRCDRPDECQGDKCTRFPDVARGSYKPQEELKLAPAPGPNPVPATTRVAPPAPPAPDGVIHTDTSRTK